jgi:hypothetical protein
MADIAGRPQWELHFDEKGKVTGGTSIADIVAGVAARGVTDLFVFSHGWNEDDDDARRLYAKMFPLIAAAAAKVPAIKAGAGFLGIYWPSIWFPDESSAPAGAGGRSDAQSSRRGPALPPLGAGTATMSGADLVDAVEGAYPPSARATLRRLGKLIDQGEAGVRKHEAEAKQQARLDEFVKLMPKLAAAAAVGEEDRGEAAVVTPPPDRGARNSYVLLSDTMGGLPRAGDAEGLGDIFRDVWHGAKEAVRVASFFQMKARAGTVGTKGLAPLLTALRSGAPAARVHLLGHSFGARLVSFSLSAVSAGSSPVRSLTLIQGAFSHWSFAAEQPWGHAGALAGFADRVKGPLVATFSSKDRAVGEWYPAASVLNQQDNQAASDFARRWGGMGADGFQKLPAADKAVAMGAAGTDYGLAPGGFRSIDGSKVIAKIQSAFAGAHSDILHPEVAWAVVAAARAGAPA